MSVLLLSLLTHSSSEPPPFTVAAYLPEWRFDSANYERICRTVNMLIFFSIEVHGNGTLAALDRLPRLSLVREARPHCKRMLLCVGGNGRSGGFSAAVSSRKSRRRFISALLRLCEKAGFDGVDYNWEYPGFAFGSGYKSEDDVARDYHGLQHLLIETREAHHCAETDTCTWPQEGTPPGPHRTLTGSRGRSTHGVARDGDTGRRHTQSAAAESSPLAPSGVCSLWPSRDAGHRRMRHGGVGAAPLYRWWWCEQAYYPDRKQETMLGLMPGHPDPSRSLLGTFLQERMLGVMSEHVDAMHAMAHRPRHTRDTPTHCSLPGTARTAQNLGRLRACRHRPSPPVPQAYDQSGRHSTYAFAEKVAAQAVELLPPSKARRPWGGDSEASRRVNPAPSAPEGDARASLLRPPLADRREIEPRGAERSRAEPSGAERSRGSLRPARADRRRGGGPLVARAGRALHRSRRE